MTSRFRALPVGAGDAFLLDRGNKRVLIDGGRSQKKLFELFETPINNRLPEIVVCTHADADHMDGLVGLLETGGKKGHKFEEVWLPGRWVDRYEEMRAEPCKFVQEASEQLLEIDGFPGLERYGEWLADHGAIAQDVEAGSRTERVTCPRVYSLEERNSSDEIIWPHYRVPWTTFAKRHDHEPANLHHVAELVSQVERLLRLVELARTHSHRIRWFDFDEALKRGTADGGDPCLVPVNSVEVTEAPRRRNKALDHLALTVVNRESLVFYAPETDDEPGVLLTADSNLRFASGRTRKNPVWDSFVGGKTQVRMSVIRLAAISIAVDATCRA